MDFLSLVAKLSLDSSEYEGGLNKAKGLATTLGNGIKTGFKMVGTAVGVATAAVGAFGASAVKTGAEFDSAMSQVAATLGYTTDDIANNVGGAGDAFNALREKAEEAGRSTIFSASESAEGLNILAMSGYNAEESIAMLDDVLHLAAAGSMDMASAAGYVSGTMKGFNDETKDSAYYADLMAKGATLANTSVQQLGEAMSSGAAGAASYGQSADSMTVALLRLAEQGEVGSAAGTALAAAMKDIYTGTDQAKKALEELGVDAFDPITHEARDFNEVVNDLQASMQGMTDEEQANYKQTIFGIQGLNAYNKMVVSGIEKQNEWANALANSAGEAEKQYGTMTANLEGDIAGWNSALEGFKIAISEGIMPSLREFVQFGTTGLQSITSAFKSGGLTGAMETFGTVLSDGLNMVIAKVPEITNAAMELLKAFGKGIIDNAPEIITALFAVGDQVLQTMNQVLEQALTALQEFDFGETAANLMEKLSSGFEGSSLEKFLSLGFQITEELITGMIEGLPEILSSAGDIVNNLANGIAEKAPEMIPAAVQLISDFLQAITDPTAVTKFLQAAVTIIVALAQGIVNSIPILLRDIPKIISNIVGALVAAMPQLLSMGYQLMITFASGIISAIPDIVAVFPRLILAMVGGLNQGISAIKETGGQLIEGFINGVTSAWNSAVSTITTFFKDLVDRVKSLLGIHSPSTIFMEIGKSLIQGLVNGIQNMMSNLRQKATEIVNVFKELPAKVIDVGKNIVEGIWQGISGATGWIKNQISSWVGDVTSFLKGLFGINSPSTVMRDQVGKNIGLGVAAGIMDTLPDVERAMSDMTNVMPNPEINTSLNISGTNNAGFTGFNYNPDSEEYFTVMADAFVRALERYGLAVEIDHREFGRVVRKEVLA